jgi:hypothetical protein
MIEFIVVLTLYGIIAAIIEARHDYHVIQWYKTGEEKHNKKWKKWDVIERTWMITVLPCLLLNYELVFRIFLIVQIAFTIAITRWIFMDIALNKFSGWGWWYVGTTAWLDRTFGKFQFALKGLLITIGMYLVWTEFQIIVDCVKYFIGYFSDILTS